MVPLNVQSLLSTWGTVLAFVGSLAAVWVGWLLREFSDSFKLLREDKRAVGRVLAELLEVRHRLLALPAIMAHVRGKVPIAPAGEVAFRNAFENLIPGFEQLQKRYNDSIDGIAGALPLLAFRLRSKDIATPVLAKLRVFVMSDPRAVSIMVQAEDELVKLVLPTLDELLLELARRHSWKTWWRLGSILKTPQTVPEEAEGLVSSILAEAQKGQTSPAVPPEKL